MSQPNIKPVNTNLKTHHDYIEDTGGNYKATKNRAEKQWNIYYHLSQLAALKPLLFNVPRGAIMDLGTSEGIWYPIIKSWGFKTIYGVELHPGRAEKARTMGYEEVFTCDAADIPLPENSLDAVIANAVIVLILQPEDKIKIMQRIEKILKPGGVFIFSQPPARPHNYPDGHIEKHCRFVSMDWMIRLVQEHTDLELQDVRPTYYHWRTEPCPRILRFLRNRITWPGVPYLMHLYDKFWTQGARPLEDSDNLYFSFAKPKK